MTNPNELVLTDTQNGVCTITMNMPRRLNGWTEAMLRALGDALAAARRASDVKVVILTGADPYYCAGVNLGGTLKVMHPRALRAIIIERNQALFDQFIDFPKPILVAVNGPAIGAAVTSATLCDAIIASDKATFSTPFAKLGVAREGCSSVQFARLMSEANAERMLGAEGWVPTGHEAVVAGLADWVVPHAELEPRAREIAEEWIEQGASRTFRGGSTRDELKRVNAEESVRLADSFLSAPFLRGQFNFLRKKKKAGPAAMFLTLWLTRPAWSRLL